MQSIRHVVRGRLRELAWDCKAATAFEYVVMLTVIILACLVLITLIGLWTASGFAEVTGTVPG